MKKLTDIEIITISLLPLPKNDAGAGNIFQYLQELLLKVWVEEDNFSGKRPFGNSGWKYEIAKELIKADLVGGKLDKDGYVEKLDNKRFNDIMIQVIKFWTM